MDLDLSDDRVLRFELFKIVFSRYINMGMNDSDNQRCIEKIIYAIQQFEAAIKGKY